MGLSFSKKSKDTECMKVCEKKCPNPSNNNGNQTPGLKDKLLDAKNKLVSKITGKDSSESNKTSTSNPAPSSSNASNPSPATPTDIASNSSSNSASLNPSKVGGGRKSKRKRSMRNKLKRLKKAKRSKKKYKR